MKTNTKLHIISLFVLLFLFMQFQPAQSLACTGKISGEITYDGDLAESIVVMAVRIPPTPEKLYYATKLESPGPYEICDLPEGIYVVSAFMDVDGSEGPNPGEPVGLFMEFIMIEGGSEFENANISLQELPAGMGSISGKINYFGNKTGPVKVIAIGLSYTPFNYTMVDLSVNNSFTIDNLMTGSYMLFAYLDVNRDGLPWLNEPFGAETDLIFVMDGADTPNQTITLIDPESHSGSISGQITYDGTRSGPVYVTAMGLTFTPMMTTRLNSGETEFQLLKLAQGDYGVMAFIDVNGDMRPNATEPMGYFTDGFVTVTEGSETAGIHIKLIDPPVGQGVVKGTITCDFFSLGKPNTCHNIVVQAMGLSETPLVSTKITDYGEYELAGLTTGLYFIIAYEDMNDNGLYDLTEPIGLFQGNPVIIIEQWQRNDVDIAIQDPTTATGSLSGTITYEGPRSGAIHVYTIGLSHTPFQSQVINEPGAYKFTDLALGVYYVMAYMDADSDGKYDIGEPLAFYTGVATVVGGFEKQGVDLTLYDKGTGSISGNVVYDGEESGKIYVGAFGLSNTPIAKISLDTPGAYTLDGLCKGRFVAWAFMDLNGDKLPGLYEPFAITSQVIHVEDSLETANVNLVLSTFYPTDVDDQLAMEAMPQRFQLMQNFPNPFNSSTLIQYQLPDASRVTLRIFNMLGREIRTMVLGQNAAGTHQLAWDARSNSGEEVASGFYLYQIEAGEFKAMKKLLLVR
ncbi:T9SS type A sorting domain-containing protein [candidate division KSB1 bacterium]|nr:T9SS type A sorting domain-containing protein [candidate division KSB1 bacterium]